MIDLLALVTNKGTFTVNDEFITFEPAGEEIEFNWYIMNEKFLTTPDTAIYTDFSKTNDVFSEFEFIGLQRKIEKLIEVLK